MNRIRNRNTQNIQTYCELQSCKVKYNHLVTGGNNPTLTKRNAYSHIFNHSKVYSTTAIYNKDNIVHSFQYLTNSLTSITFSFTAKPFVMSCILRAVPEDKQLPIITVDLKQVTRNNSERIVHTFNSLDSVSNYKIVVLGTDIFNVSSTILGETLFKGPQGLMGDKGARGPTGIGEWGDIGFTGQFGSTGPIGQIGPMGPMGPIGPIGPTGIEGSLQLWNRDASLNLTTYAGVVLDTYKIPLANLYIGEGTSTVYVHSIMADQMVVKKSDISETTFQSLSIGGATVGQNQVDISGNVFISGKIAIQQDTVSYFNMDISGSVNIQKELIMSKLYHNYGIPEIVDPITIRLDYHNGDNYYLKMGMELVDNYSCVILNLPNNRFTPFVITIIHDFTYDQKYYCNNVVLGDQSYTPQFNKGIQDASQLASIFVQKLTLMYFSPTGVRFICDIFNYT